MIRTVWRKQEPFPDTETAPPQPLVRKIWPKRCSREGFMVVHAPHFGSTPTSSRATARLAVQQRLDQRASGGNTVLRLQHSGAPLRLPSDFRHEDSLAQHADQTSYRQFARVHGEADTQANGDRGMKYLLLEIGHNQRRATVAKRSGCDPNSAVVAHGRR